MIRAMLLLAALLSGAAASARPPLVLAAASLQESLGAAADAWAAAGHERPVLSFAASSALARQIDAGAPADLFVSADEAWMDDVARHGRLRPGTRADLAGNRLVLIAPAGTSGDVAIARGLPLARLLGRGRLAMADPDAVPAGRYGRAALVALGLWPQVRARIAAGESVRAALALVERRQARFGIVYATDAATSKAVRVVGTFPAGSHPPIRYPIATLAAARGPEGDAFRRFMLSPAGRSIFRRHGFIVAR